MSKICANVIKAPCLWPMTHRSPQLSVGPSGGPPTLAEPLSTGSAKPAVTPVLPGTNIARQHPDPGPQHQAWLSISRYSSAAWRTQEISQSERHPPCRVSHTRARGARFAGPAMQINACGDPCNACKQRKSATEGMNNYLEPRESMLYRDWTVWNAPRYRAIDVVMGFDARSR
ncbi:hypothetical protein OBBRIDRAFT_211630 [Obba rivulosa]|uniref:Uncharacterized protein n=1 Tax=Obba rivulosa TaxID=1052685 RepID=A0A8E2ARM3_9APHY|nr:hypothetical protein OBBRIDRAFT_211630 [Obba rivulosa]